MNDFNDELITVSNGVALLDAQAAAKIEDFERRIKAIKEAEDALKAAILAEMESKNILSIKTESMAISFVAESERESLDTKKLKEEKPDIYDEYVKFSPVKASIRIKLK